MYSAQRIRNFQKHVQLIEQGGILRKVFKPLLFMLDNQSISYRAKLKCKACHEPFELQDMDYGKPLREVLVKCPKGSIDDGHGVLFSIIKMVLN